MNTESPSDYLIRRWEIITAFEQEVQKQNEYSAASVVWNVKHASDSQRRQMILDKFSEAIEIIMELDPDDPYWDGGRVV